MEPERNCCDEFIDDIFISNVLLSGVVRQLRTFIDGTDLDAFERWISTRFAHDLRRHPGLHHNIVAAIAERRIQIFIGVNVNGRKQRQNGAQED